jgi:hypothetical protein
MSGRAGYLGHSGVAVTKNPPYPLRVESELAGPKCRQSATGLGVGNGDRLPLRTRYIVVVKRNGPIY